MNQILQPDSGLDGVAMIEDIGNQASIELIQANQRVVGHNEVRPGVSSSPSAYPTASSESIFDDLDHLRFCVGLDETLRLEFQRLRPVLVRVVGFVLGHQDTAS